jgi:hypothetical protein
MRRIAFMIVLLLSVTGCLSSQPAAPRVTQCTLIAVSGGSPYLYCTLPDGSKSRVPISSLPSRPERYLCTDDNGYADAVNYQRAMSRWVDTHCR